MSYAQNTSVPVEKSKAEIEGYLMRYGADQFVSGWEQGRAMIGFRYHERFIRFTLPLPNRNDQKFKRTPGGRKFLNDEQSFKQWEQACRQRWRALCLCIKAKLEAVTAGITTFENEFLAHIVLPSGQTAGEWLCPQIENATKTGAMPKLLIDMSGGQP